jgi:hypothetical protein
VLAPTSVSHIKMKHIELHAHYLRQLVHEKVVTLVYCNIDDHIDNIFTKPLSKDKFVKIHNMLRLQVVAIMGVVLLM